ncbi:MAG: glycerophosphodiester phosphodiesterase [Austwickia sp.]|jgi:glycerophosphoryl diester phosphodiesterase|nr:MAG: glycerophosphodiester phosphodiesterase [Austwickia sp.]
MRYVEAGWPIGLVHRGGGILAPENTLAAFAYSVALGYRYLESDVRVTADGHIVLFHDATLDRVTDATGPVSERSLAELRQLQVRGPAGWTGEPTPETAICTLEEALDAFPDACFSVDLKDPRGIDPLIRILRRPGVADRICVAGAWDRALAHVRAEAPGVATALGWRALTGLMTCARLRLPAPRSLATGEFVHVPLALGAVGVWDDAVVGWAHGVGLRVVAWTVDTPEAVARLLNAGVDAVITDRPDVVREVLLARAAWRPMAGPEPRHARA